MKKTYSAPTSQAVTFAPVLMLDASRVEVKTGGTEVDAGDAFAPGQSWDSDQWTYEEE